MISAKNRTKTANRTRRPSLKQAVQAVTAAGVPIARVEIDKTGRIVIVAASASADAADELDVELQQWEAQHGKS